MPNAAAISAATALRWPTSQTKITLSDLITSCGLAMICPSGVSLALGMWSRAYSQFSRTSTIFNSPVVTRSLASFGLSRPKGSAWFWFMVLLRRSPENRKDTGLPPKIRQPMPSKQLSLDEAIARFVPDGAGVAMGMALESLIPFAAGHDLIRQQRHDLELIGPISDMLFDQLIGAGCARRVTAAWVGNVSAGLGHNYRRAVEQGVPGPLEIEEHSNFSVGLGLLAGAMGVPYLPTRTLLGSDLARYNQRIRAAEPGLLHVAAIRPDVAILQVQRSDVDGRAHSWGNLGLTREAGLAAHQVILVAEEIVPADVVLSDPNRILLPPHQVSAVVHVPGGAHPSPVQGYYGRDHAAFGEYHHLSRSREGFQQWLREWVLNTPNREAYLAKLGARFAALRPSAPRLAAA